MPFSTAMERFARTWDITQPRGAEGIGMLKPDRNFRSRRDEPRRCRKSELKLAERATEDLRL